MESGKRILIADDDPDIIDLLESYFTRAGFRVTAKVNGKDALQAAEAEKFDLVLLDVMMPYIDGYHVASEKGIALLSGATDAVQKPFSLNELDAKVKAALE